MKRVLLLLPTTTYRTHDFLDAGRKLGIETVVGTDRKQAFAEAVPEKNLTFDFADPHAASDEIARFADDHPVHGELLITPPSGARRAPGNVPATGISGDQLRVDRCFMVEKRRAERCLEQDSSSACFHV